MKFSKLLLILIGLAATVVMFTKDNHKVIMRDNGIWVYEYDGKRCLSFSTPPSDARQTCIYLDAPDVLVFDYQKLMMASLYLNPTPKRILVMGLGGGTMISALQNLLPSAKIDVVEINQNIISLANNFFHFKENDHTKVFIEDAYEFVEKHQENKYDLILFDVFDNNYIPEKFLTEKFLLSLKKMLAKNGVIAFNTFLNSTYSKLENEIFYSVFGTFYNLEMTNRVIISSEDLPDLKIIKQNGDKLENKFEKIGVKKQLIFDKFDIMN